MYVHTYNWFQNWMFMHRRGISQCFWHNLLPKPQAATSCRHWDGPGWCAIDCPPGSMLHCPPLLHSLVNIGGIMENRSLASPKHPCCHMFKFCPVLHLVCHWSVWGRPSRLFCALLTIIMGSDWYITNSSSCEVERACSIGLRHRCLLSWVCWERCGQGCHMITRCAVLATLM